LKNPVDPGAVGMTKLTQIIATVGNEPYIDSILSVGSSDFMVLMPSDEIREIVREGIAAAVAQGASLAKKPFFLCTMQMRDNEQTYHYHRLMLDRLEEKGLCHLHGSFSEIARVFSKLAQYKRFLEKNNPPD